MDKYETKGSQFSCAKICVEVDLEKELPSEININLGEWKHKKVLYYEEIPFKCRHCHDYGHFARDCTKIGNDQSLDFPVAQEEQWKKPKKALKGKGSMLKPRSMSVTNMVPSSSNPFKVLSDGDMEMGSPP